jgi:hypothetical protein
MSSLTEYLSFREYSVYFPLETHEKNILYVELDRSFFVVGLLDNNLRQILIVEFNWRFAVNTTHRILCIIRKLAFCFCDGVKFFLLLIFFIRFV